MLGGTVETLYPTCRMTPACPRSLPHTCSSQPWCKVCPIPTCAGTPQPVPTPVLTLFHQSSPEATLFSIHSALASCPTTCPAWVAPELHTLSHLSPGSLQLQLTMTGAVPELQVNGHLSSHPLQFQLPAKATGTHTLHRASCYTKPHFQDQETKLLHKKQMWKVKQIRRERNMFQTKKQDRNFKQLLMK